MAERGERLMKKFLALLMLTVCSPVFAVEIPDVIDDWHMADEKIVPLITDYNNELQGRVIYRTYKRENPIGVLEVIITEGSGTGRLYVPEKVNDKKGMMPGDSGFEVLSVDGHAAVLEEQSFMPLVLAVDCGDNITLNLESPSTGKEELMKIAEVILSSWRVTKSD